MLRLMWIYPPSADARATKFVKKKFCYIIACFVFYLPAPEARADLSSLYSGSFSLLTVCFACLQSRTAL